MKKALKFKGIINKPQKNQKRNQKLKLITKTTVLVVFLLSTLTFSQMSDDWEWMNPKPQGNSIFAVDFVNDNTGYAAGDFGTMIKTNDNGAT